MKNGKRENEIQSLKRCFFAVASQITLFYAQSMSMSFQYLFYSSHFNILHSSLIFISYIIEQKQDMYPTLCKHFGGNLQTEIVSCSTFLFFNFSHNFCCILYLLYILLACLFVRKNDRKKIGFMFSSILATTYNAFTT